MKFSIITVCFNSEKTIENTVKSVLSQKYKNIEYIVIDGKSSDSTLNILDKYKQNIDLLISEKDTGIYDAFNKGLSYATGDVITYLNSDDYYCDDNVLTKVSEEFVKSPTIDMIYGDVIYVKSGKIIRKYSSKKFKLKYLEFGFFPAHPSIFLKKKIYDKYGVYDNTFNIAGDFEFICRILLLGINIKYINQVITIMSLGGKSSISFKNILIINDEILKACRINKIKTNGLKLLLRYPVKLFEFIIK